MAGLAVAAGLVAVAAFRLLDRGPVATNPNVVVTLNGGTTGSAQPAGDPRPSFTRPDWILSDVPSAGYCHDMINRLMCVGVSTFRGSRDEGASEASDVALDELVNAVALKISDTTFKDVIVSQYSPVRGKTLSDLQAAELDRKNDSTAAAAFAAASEAVRKTRNRVVEELRASGGAAVPAQRSDWYWEEYARENGKGTEFLVFIRYDVPMDAVRALVERYSATTTVLGSTVTTAFPALAWSRPAFVGGAWFTSVHGPFADAGIAARQTAVAVGGQRVSDATSFANAVEAAHGNFELTISSADTPQKVVAVKRSK